MKEKKINEIGVKHYEGLDIYESSICSIKLTNLFIRFKNQYGKEIKVIDLKDIINAAIIDDKELVQEDKSVISRGLFGGILFGGVGLVLGGLSGVGSKQIKNSTFIVINYKENGEDKVISVYTKKGLLNKSFIKGLNYAIDFSKEDKKCPKCNNAISVTDIKCSNCGFNLRNKKDKRTAKVVGGILIFIIGFIIFTIIMATTFGSSPTNKNVDLIIEELNLNEETAKNINNVFDKVGINEFESIIADSETLDGLEGNNSKGYRIKTDFSSNVILYLSEDNEVISIRFADEDYYRNNEVLKEYE